MARPRRTFGIGFGVLLGFLVLGSALLGPFGCGKDKTTEPPPPSLYLPQSSIVNVLENLKTAYVQRDLEQYQKLFAQDFTFVFNPRDVQGQNPTPRLWGRPGEYESAEGLFSSDIVDQIELDYSLDTAVGDTLHEGTTKLFAVNIRLTVHTRTPGGEALYLQVPGDVNTFYLQEYPAEKASDGRNLWRIVWWYDEPTEAAKGIVDVTSWGAIKNLFRPAPPSLYLPQSSVVNVLENLKTAYVQRDLEQYQKLFAQDFTFVFNPRDVQGQNPTPPLWGRREESESAEGLFVSEVVDRIELHYLLDTAVGDTLHEGTTKLFVVNIRLTVHTRTETGESILLQVPGDVNTFYLQEYPAEKATDGKNLWRIVWWCDEPMEPAKGMTERTSWGRIKNAFL